MKLSEEERDALLYLITRAKQSMKMSGETIAYYYHRNRHEGSTRHEFRFDILWDLEKQLLREQVIIKREEPPDFFKEDTI